MNCTTNLRKALLYRLNLMMNDRLQIQNPRLAILLLLALSAFAFFANLGGFPIYILDEAKNASCAREMWEQQEWIVPTYNYNLRTDKPPLHYYFMMLSYQLFGVSAFSARFFSALMGIATVFITFFYTRRHTNLQTGFLAALILISAVHAVFQFHLAVPDPYLICTMTLAFFAFYTAIQEDIPAQYYLGYAATGCAVLSKGILPIGLIGLTFLTFLIWTKRLTWSQIQALRPIRGGLLFLTIALPWYILVGQATQGEWLQGFFFKHNFGRFASEMEGHGGPFFLPLVYVLVGLLPFATFLPQSIFKAWQQRRQPFLLFALLASSITVGFFCLSATKLPNYTVPAYPFLAILLAHFLHAALQQPFKGIFWGIITLIIIGFALPIAVYFLAQIENLAQPILWSLLSSSLFFAGSLGIYFFQKGQVRASLLAIALGGIFLSCTTWYGVLPALAKDNSVDQASALILTDEPIAFYKRMNRAFAFQLKRRIEPLDSMISLSDYLKNTPDAQVLTITRYLEELEASDLEFDILHRQKDLFENTTTLLLKFKAKPNAKAK